MSPMDDGSLNAAQKRRFNLEYNGMDGSDQFSSQFNKDLLQSSLLKVGENVHIIPPGASKEVPSPLLLFRFEK